MERKVQVTGDGSHTISIPAAGITYHSTHGAVQESMHVFIEAGLMPFLPVAESVNIFEMGFGTGLNALLALQLAIGNKLPVYYTAAELYPLTAAEYTALNYSAILGKDFLQPFFLQMHAAAWEEDIVIHPLFTLHKIKGAAENDIMENFFDIVFYDAFAPNDQPEMWTEKIFSTMFAALKKGGILVTYCSKGVVRRALKSAGFTVEKMPGPPGKREITRAKK
ncbi:MAG TPA: tRNA (5-methylaminomethyl-2-thiouridine)(34)-methyltransferase MnmD [Chitinophagaceae bacterium]|nr:tRNA (5-methylaminomethyl-2-thiouridine)(34)-methyltransferase MnmD [Chitinophagaceae bacterium]